MIGSVTRREYDRQRYLARAEEVRERARLAYRADPEKARKRISQWQANNPEKVARYRARQLIAHAESERERLQRYGLEHPEKVREAKRRWKRANPGKRDAWKLANPIKAKAYERAAVAKRRARLLEATPVWVTKDEFRKIRELHAKAARLTIERGEPYHVDHILPLRGRRVCGLHVFANMQVLRATDNHRKSNLENWDDASQELAA